MTSDLFSLAGKIILVTGASRGLGRAMAAAMADAGAHVMLNGRDLAALAAASKAISDSGGSVETAAFDVTDEGAVKAAIAGIVARHGRLDVLVGNAGIQHRRPLLDFATPDWQRVIDTNLTACFVLAREAARPMIERRQGRIILTASMMGPAIARPTVAAYVAAKGGLVALTKALAVELAPIRVNVVAPGVVRTPLWVAMSDADRQAMYDQAAQQLPLGRIGEVADIARAYLYCMEQEFGTGIVLTVDGGTVLV